MARSENEMTRDKKMINLLENILKGIDSLNRSIKNLDNKTSTGKK